MEKFYSTDGQHIIADLYDCEDNPRLNDKKFLEDMVREAVRVSKAKLVFVNSHEYPKQGITVLACIEESSATLHSYPENCFCAVDLYTCGEKTRPELGIQYIVSQLKPKHVESSKVQRGNMRNLAMGQVKTRKRGETFGYSLLLDLYNCSPAKKLDDLRIGYDFLDTLPAKIGMEKQAPPYLFRSDATKYPDKAGLSGGVYLIESGIQFHTIVPKKFVTLDVYSCKKFDPQVVIDEATKLYHPKDIDDQFLYRGVDY